MAEQNTRGPLRGGERLTAFFLGLLPWLAFLACALPLPAYFLLRYFGATEGAGEYMLLALTSLGVGALVGLFAAVAAYALRRVWEGRLRERLALDGVTARELKWFLREVPAERRRALRQMEKTNPLLAEAYRESLASGVTAARVLANARRESAAVGKRLAGAARAAGGGRAELERDLRKDEERIGRVLREASVHRAEIETRLQKIEALAARDASERETQMALARLGTAREHEPPSLAAAREESDAREEVERELRRPRPSPGGESG